MTGAGGFIGSHLVERLVKLGAKTRAFVHYNAMASRGWLDRSGYQRAVEIVAGDICDYYCVRKAMEDVDVVFHLAALIAIPYSYQAPASYVHVNIIGTLNVLQAARELNIDRVVHTSTSEVYGTAQYIPIDERHPLQGQSPYSASKIGADKLAESFHLSFGLNIITIRPFNTFGPRQSARAVIPAIIIQALESDEIRLGNLQPTRDLNYVSDTVDGFVAAGSALGIVGQTINLGTGREIQIGELAALIGRLLGKDLRINSDQARMRPDASEVDRLLANNTKARNLLGWTPHTTLEEGLRLTIDWLRQNRDYYRPNIYVV